VVSREWPERLTQTREEHDGFVDVICAHGVHTPEMLADGLPPTSSVTIESFRANLEILARLREVITLPEAIKHLKQGNRPRKRMAVLTFDDSLACTSRISIPEILRVGIPATVFVSTDILDTGRPYWWLRFDYAWRQAKSQEATFSSPNGEVVLMRRDDLLSMRRAKSVLRGMDAVMQDSAVRRIEEAFGVRLSDPAAEYRYAEAMSWEDVRGLVAQGIGVGSHTVTHPNLELLSPDEVAWELGESKSRLERELGVSCESFCYPYGKFVPWVPAMVREAGYQCATSTVAPGRNLSGQDPYLLKRFPITSEPYKLGYELSGFPRWIRGSRGKG
jgi:peptidoglycan/xylan/chitin deacetylase (PgdA/CDA1 family)